MNSCARIPNLAMMVGHGATRRQLFGCDKVLLSYCIVEPLSLVSATKVPDSKILWYGSRDSLADPLYSFHLSSLDIGLQKVYVLLSRQRRHGKPEPSCFNQL